MFKTISMQYVLILLVTSFIIATNGLVNPASRIQGHQNHLTGSNDGQCQHEHRGFRSRLHMSIWDDVKSFFDPDSSKDKQSAAPSATPMSNSNSFGGKSNVQGARPQENGSDIDDNEPAGTYRVVTIPVESLKPGGLRLFLMFYLMGLQNTPERNTWRANQPNTPTSGYNSQTTADDYVLEFWFHDSSAILSIMLGSKEIRVNRIGSQPSNAYLMQESVVLQGLLDELQSCAMDGNVTVTDRLIVLPSSQPHAIEDAREMLAFG
jgi:hypothetical protein